MIMSADLYIDANMLASVRTNFQNIETLLSTPARTMKAMTADQVGPQALRERINQFGDDWGYGIGKLGEFSGAVVDALDAIEQAFDEADTNLADALNEAKA